MFVLVLILIAKYLGLPTIIISLSSYLFISLSLTTYQILSVQLYVTVEHISVSQFSYLYSCFQVKGWSR